MHKVTPCPWVVMALAAWSVLGCTAGQQALEPRSAAPSTAIAGSDTASPRLCVVTYNVNYGLAGDEATLEAVGHAAADIVLLQETTAPWEAVLRERYRETYPHMAFRHCCGAGGLAVLAKMPFVEKDYLPAQAGWFPAWRLLFDTALGRLQVLSVHLRPPVSDSGGVVSGYLSTPPTRELEMTQFYASLEPGLPTLVVGDFNEGSGGRAVGYLERRGLRSALPQFDGPQDTWRWSTRVGTIHTQLDHIVHDRRLRPVHVEVLQRGRSDHWPVVGTFELRHRGDRVELSDR